MQAIVCWLLHIWYISPPSLHFNWYHEFVRMLDIIIVEVSCKHSLLFCCSQSLCHHVSFATTSLSARWSLLLIHSHFHSHCRPHHCCCHSSCCFGSQTYSCCYSCWKLFFAAVLLSHGSCGFWLLLLLPRSDIFVIPYTDATPLLVSDLVVVDITDVAFLLLILDWGVKTTSNWLPDWQGDVKEYNCGGKTEEYFSPA